jgi:hypothetical protein
MSRPRFDESDEEFDARSKRRGQYTGYVLLAVLLTFCGAIFYPVWLGARPVGVSTRALSQIKQAGLSALMYASDEDDHLPFAANWMDALSPYTKDESCLHSPGAQERAAKPEVVYGIAFRRRLSGTREPKIEEPDKVVLIFDASDLRRNAAGDLNLLPRPPRYGSVNVVAFVDGHASATPRPGVVLK